MSNRNGVVKPPAKKSGTAFPYYNEALVGRATYDYSNKYFLR